MKKYILVIPLLTLIAFTGCNDEQVEQTAKKIDEVAKVEKNTKDTYLLKNEVDGHYFGTYKDERDKFYESECRKFYDKNEDKTFANIQDRIIRSNCVTAYTSIYADKLLEEGKKQTMESMKAIEEATKKATQGL